MRTKHKLLGLLLTLLICLAPWNGVALAEKLPEIVAIDILTTNDFHGALVEAGKNPGAAKFGAFLLQQRAKNPYGSIFVSAGDMFQGSPDSNLLYGKTVVEVLNALQMDAMTLGNHEFDWGLDKLAARVAESRFPYVSANVREKDGQGRLSFVYDYPVSQAALARLRPGDPPVGERFELYLHGVELANGFHELGDAAEQRRRFERENAKRSALGLPAMPVDEHLLAALDSGLPECAGVALGFDRLVMAAAGKTLLQEVIAFPVDSA